MTFDFYKGKKVFITGHTGFKGSWLCKVLLNVGAEICGYSLEPPTCPSLYQLSNIDKDINSNIGDIRDYEKLSILMGSFKPEIVFHLAAQPIVRDSYMNPMYTYETNVMGTVHILECIKTIGGIKSFLNVTTDKVYDNKEWDRGYREDDCLDGFDPYSNSKSCSELVTHSYKRSFFDKSLTNISTARAGNVIGGGDFAKDRIIPDCIRAAEKKEDIIVRNPFSMRPYQHVLDPVFAYVLIAEKQFENDKYSDYYNVGPNDQDCITTKEIVELFCDKWGDIGWIDKHDGGPHEANLLKLDCAKIKSKLGWKPKWNIETSIEKVVEWTKHYLAEDNIGDTMDKQIGEFIRG